MSLEFQSAGATVQHARTLEGTRQSVIVAIRQAIQASRPKGIIAWHGMVVLPEILRALDGFDGRVLVHGGNPTESLPRWVDLRHLLREWRLGRRCDATYVCCSRYVADSFDRSFYLRRFPRVVVPNGVAPLTVPPHEPREIHPAAPFTIGMVARLDAIKDHATLLRAFALVLKEWPAARLELAGDGERRGALEQMADDLGIAEQVRFLGMVRDVYVAMENWDLFAYATTGREGMGNALAEAMMFGLPCIATDAGPIREVGGPCIEYVRARDDRGLAELVRVMISDRDDRLEIGCAAKRRAEEEFSAATFAGRYLELLGPLAI